MHTDRQFFYDQQFSQTHSLDTKNGHEMGLGEAVWADFLYKINSATSPIDLDGFRRDLTTPKIQKNPGRSRVSFLNYMFLNDMEGGCS